jgi:integrase/recombinase XerC
MARALVPLAASAASIPAVIAASGESARLRFLEFFASNIRNRHTRLAYSRAVREFLA